MGNAERGVTNACFPPKESTKREVVDCIPMGELMDHINERGEVQQALQSVSTEEMTGAELAEKINELGRRLLLNGHWWLES